MIGGLWRVPVVNKQEQHTTFSCITSGFFIFNNIVRGLAYQLISANHKFYFAQNVMFTMYMCVQVYPRPCPCSWLVGNLRLSEECRICPNKGDTLSLDSTLGYELYFLSHGHGRVWDVTPFWQSERIIWWKSREIHVVESREYLAVAEEENGQTFRAQTWL